ncbi:MAG TPA: 3-oxoacyl-[acyl-carrier-protein] synthase III C-terminal domain-containing protein [Planctomycetota bacterium]|jgi:alkylresorcinol/alkylpyrone synthase|nr:3-oxoacyl-[acyl-carrier-protein] synthase III C-terminal domain-containing protein [Planctomycetota bacterium]
MTSPSRPRPRIASVATAVPEYALGAEETTECLVRLFPAEDPEFVRALVARSGVERRYFPFPAEQLLSPGDFTLRNARYAEVALELCHRAGRTALERAALDPGEVDVVLDVSCTGISIPALDVDLAPRLGLRPDACRVPITESGCAGGGLGLGLATRFARGGERVLLVAVELCSGTLVREDRSRTNLVAGALFGDGAAAAVVLPEGRGPRIVATGSHLFPATRAAMGFDVGTHGLRILLQRELPEILRRELRPAVEAFLARHGRTAGDVGLHLLHPGGRRVLEVYGEVFALENGALRFSREALRRYGNLSSASILAVLDLAFEAGARPDPGKEGLLVAFGPGLSAEMALLSWENGR